MDSNLLLPTSSVENGRNDKSFISCLVTKTLESEVDSESRSTCKAKADRSGTIVETSKEPCCGLETELKTWEQ